MKVILSFFRDSGEFYSDAEFDLEDLIDTSVDIPLYMIWDIVDKMRENKDERTGLMSGGLEFYCTIDVPDHPHNHPRLLLPRQLKLEKESGCLDPH